MNYSAKYFFTQTAHWSFVLTKHGGVDQNSFIKVNLFSSIFFVQKLRRSLCVTKFNHDRISIGVELENDYFQLSCRRADATERAIIIDNNEGLVQVAYKLNFN